MAKPKPNSPYSKFIVTKWTHASTCGTSFNHLQCPKDSHIQPYGLDTRAKIKCMYVQNLTKRKLPMGCIKAHYRNLTNNSLLKKAKNTVFELMFLTDRKVVNQHKITKNPKHQCIQSKKWSHMALSSKHIHMDHLNHANQKVQNYGLYEKKNLIRCGRWCL